MYKYYIYVHESMKWIIPLSYMINLFLKSIHIQFLWITKWYARIEFKIWAQQCKKNKNVKYIFMYIYIYALLSELTFFFVWKFLLTTTLQWEKIQVRIYLKSKSFILLARIELLNNMIKTFEQIYFLQYKG